MGALCRAILVTVLLLGNSALSAEAADSPITFSTKAFAIALPKKTALEFANSHNLNADAGDKLKMLTKMVLENRAEGVANTSVACVSGNRAEVDFGAGSLEIELTWSSDLNGVTENVVFQYGEAKLATTFVAKEGEVRFLGSFDSADEKKKVTYFVFIVFESSSPVPPMSKLLALEASINRADLKDSSKNSLLPVSLTISNKSLEDVYFRFDGDGGGYLYSLYSVDKSGKRMISSTEIGSGRRTHVWLDPVRAGEAKSVQVQIPFDEIGDHKKIMFSLETQATELSGLSYKIYSNPVSVQPLQ